MKNKKITFVIGAGSTSFLGMPTTYKHSEIFDNKFKYSGELEKKAYEEINKLFGKYYTINDIYNIIDSNIALDIGLGEINNIELRDVKKKIVNSVIDEFNNRILNKNDSDYQKLVNFYYELAKYQLGLRFNNHSNMESKEFYVSDYSIINFNWDLYSTMPIIEANQKLNDENNYNLPLGCSPKLKIFTDFNCEYVSSDSDNDFGYSVTESVARSVNKESYDAKRRIVLTKVYYPHGLQNLFKCKSCAKHSMYLGEYNIESVINKIFNKSDYLYKCPYCKSKIKSDDYDVLIQSNFKVRNAYLEEIRINMMTELRSSNKLIFIGYSLPNDDTDYITLFKSLNNIEEVYIVLFKENKSNMFIEASSVDTSDFKEDEKQTFNNYVNVFKGKKLYFNYAGFPNAIDKILEIYKNN